MAFSTSTSFLLLLRPLFVCIIMSSGARLSKSEKTFILANNCNETIWPAMTQPENFTGGGAALKPGQSIVYTAPATWHGRIWGRTGCSFDADGTGKCETGGCGEGLNCTGPGAPPASTADFALGGDTDGVDFYDVSLVDGFNLPFVIVPGGEGKSNCSAVGCEGDMRLSCPPELQERSGDGRVVACRSACGAFGSDEFCCRGSLGSPATCVATNYSKVFKQFCGDAYSYAYDPTSLKTCSGRPDYTVSFCGSRNQRACSYHNNRVICNNIGSKSGLSLRALLLYHTYWWCPLLFIYALIFVH